MSAPSVRSTKKTAPGKRGRARPGNTPLTMRDVAAMAGVSVGTVSKVLNEAPGVSPETRSRVLQMIQDLDYHPDASAQSLVARKTGSIGFIIPHTGNYSMSGAYWPILLTAITEKAAARNLNVLLSTARSEEDVDSAYRTILRGRRVDGLVVGGEQFGQKQLVELLFKGFPFVMVGQSPFVTHCHVEVDNRGGAASMTRHLVDLGHRKITMLVGPPDRTAIRERIAGYESVMAAAGLEPRIHHFDYFDEGFSPAIREALIADPRPSAVFAAAGDLVIPALSAARELRLTIPSDLAFGAFDDHPFFSYFSPPITTVSQPVHDIGETALDLLFALMDGKEPQSVVLPTKLVVRESCGAGHR